MPVDLSGPLRAAIQSLLADAKKALEAGNREQVVVAYQQVASLYRRLANETGVPTLKRQHLSNADAYEQQATRVARGQAPVASQAGAQLERGDVDEDILDKQVELLEERASVSWSDIGGLESAKEEIKLAYGISLVAMPPGVKLQGWRAILFYGPPGTGKTMLAAAISNKLQLTFYNVPLGSILSKYFGESSKLVSALFNVARKKHPSVLFMDEFESIAAERTGEESGAERRVLSSLLTELDGLRTKNDPRYILTIAATNAPRLLDRAILSRFQRKILIPLPDMAARASILKITCNKFGVVSDVPLESIANQTEWYSGRELDGVVRDAVNSMTLAMNPNLPALVDDGKEALASYTLRVRALAQEDWRRGLEHVKPRMNRERYEEFLAFEREQM